MEWEQAMRLAGLAETTIAVRLRVAALAARQIGKPLASASTDEIAGWLAGHRSAQTRLSYHQHIAAWYAHHGLDGRMAGIPRPKQPHRVPRPLTADEVRAVVEQATGAHRVWVLLAAYGGLRACEIAATGPLHLRGTRLYLPVTKGGSDGWAVVPEWVAAELRACPPWRVSAWSVSHALGRAIRGAGIDGTGHQLRHFCGTEVLRATHNLRVTQEVLRHRSPASTAIYTLVVDEERSAAVEALPR